MAYAPEWLAFENEFGYRPRVEGDLENINRQWAQIATDCAAKLTYPTPDPSVGREDRDIDQNGIKVRIYHPAGFENSSKTLPLVFYIHGGGWVLGDLEIEDNLCAELCKGCSLVIISIDYRLSPKYKYPIPLEDCISGYKWAVQNAASLGASTSKIIIAGGSAGGNLAIATVLKLLDDKSSLTPSALLAIVPVTIDPRAVPDRLKGKYTAYEENHDTGPNTPSGMRGFVDAYGPDHDDKYYSVLLHEKIGNLPKSYVVACGKDTLRDDARLLVEALEASNVPVKCKEYIGFPHYFWTWPTPALRDVSRKFVEDTIEGTNWLLQ